MTTPQGPREEPPPGQSYGAPYSPPPYAPPPQPPYGQPYGQQYPPQPYGPQYGQPYGGPQETSSKAVVALVCAIASFVAVPLFPAIAALVLARGADRELDESGGRLTGRGLVTGARVTAWINIGLCALVLVFLLLVLVVFAGTATVRGTTT